MDLSNQRFGKLIVCKRDNTRSLGRDFWWCDCDCGNSRSVSERSLLSGHVTSCGCDNDHSVKKKNKSHGLSQTKLYRYYNNMLNRCYCEKAKYYDYYGGRGIKVCDEWYQPGAKGNPGFINFYNWSIANGYNDTLSIDRINVNGPYSPSNCRWVGWDIQSINRRNNHKVWDGDAYRTLSEIEDIYSIRHGYIGVRLFHGWDIDAIIYSIRHPELGIRLSRYPKDTRRGKYIDKDGFVCLIPKIPRPVDTD